MKKTYVHIEYEVAIVRERYLWFPFPIMAQDFVTSITKWGMGIKSCKIIHKLPKGVDTEKG